MKKLLALTMALVMLLGAFSALAENGIGSLLEAFGGSSENNAGTLTLSGLSLTHTAEKTRTVQFGKITLFIALGGSNGTPTVQATFDNGDGQVVDAVVQIVGTEILFSMGGISGVYAVDMNALATGDMNGETIAAGLGGALLLAGSRLDTLLDTFTVDEGNGVRSLEGSVSTRALVEMIQGLLSVSEGMEATQGVNMDEVRQKLAELGDEATLSFRYDENSGAFKLTAAQGDNSMQFSGAMAVKCEPMIFADINPDEERYDLLNLNGEVLEQLRGELNLIGIKFMHFADGSGLDDII